MAEIGYNMDNDIPDRQISVFLQNIVLENTTNNDDSINANN